MASLDEAAAVAIATQANPKFRRNPTSSIKEVNALLNRLTEKNNVKVKVDGGLHIDHPVTLGENQSVQNYYGSQVYATPPSRTLDKARVGWSQKVMMVTFSGRELKQNMGDSALFNYVNNQLDTARDTAANRMGIEVLLDGAIEESIQGVASFVTADGGGEYAMIDPVKWPKWRNQVGTVVANATGKQMLTAMDRLFKDCTDGTDSPDLALFPIDMYTALEEYQNDKVVYNMGPSNYMGAKDANLGFPSIKYKNGMMDVVWDRNSQFGANHSRGYFLCTKHIKIFEHPEGRWEFEKGQKPINQDVMVMPAGWMGNMITFKRRCHGVLKIA